MKNKKSNKDKKIQTKENLDLKEPSAQLMKEFANQFPRHIWNKLCFNKDFIEAVSTDLKRAEKIAEKILK